MKIKAWDITVKDHPNRVVMGENDEFYTTDTEACLVFKLDDKNFDPTSAVLTLENRNAGAFNIETVNVVNGQIVWEMPQRYIEHSGNWQGQLIYEDTKYGQPEFYTSATFSFVVKAHISDKKKPSIVTWEDMEDVRQANELQRQQAELDRRETYEKVKDLPEAFQNVIDETTGKDVISAPEIIEARKGKASLGAKIDDVEAQLAQKVTKNRGEVTNADLSQEVKEQMTGGSVAVVGENAVNTTNVIDKAITTEKRTVLGESVKMLKGTTNIPNWNFNNKTLTIYDDTIMLYRDEYFITPQTVVVDCSTHENMKVLFDVATGIFRSTHFRNTVNESEVIFCTVKHTAYPYIFDGLFEFSIDGKSLNVTEKDLHKMLEPVHVLRGGDRLPEIDTYNKELVFPGDQADWIFYVGGKPYINVIGAGKANGKVIDLSNLIATSAWCVLFNTTNKELEIKRYDQAIDFRHTHALFATFRTYQDRFFFDMPTPYLQDGKLFGYEVPPINHLDANVKGIAHRGYSIEAPENTLPAYKLAKDKGFSYVECDLVWTSDNEPVIMHDNTINRTARNIDGSTIVEPLAIKDITLDEALTYDFGIWKGAQYAGTKIPRFEDFILYCKKLNLHPYIEIKVPITEEQAAILVNICKKYGMIRKVTWISASHPSLINISNLDNSARLGYLGNLSEEFIGYVKQLKTDTNEVFANVEYQSVTPSLAESSFLQDVPIEVWTINLAHIVVRLVDMGVVGITTDELNIAKTMYNNS